MVPFKGKSLLRQYLPNKPHKWGFKIWGRSGISGFLYDFGVYQGRSTEKSKTSLPKHHNFKIFADNFFTSLSIHKLNSDGYQYVGTIRVNRTKDCPLMCETDLKKGRRGVTDYRTDMNSNIIAVKWYDNKAVNLVGCRRVVDEGMRVVGRRKSRDESDGRISYLGCQGREHGWRERGIRRWRKV